MAGWQRWCRMVVVVMVLVTGAQTQTCTKPNFEQEDLMFDLTSIAPQTSQSPFLLKVSPTKYQAGQSGTIEVTLTSARPETETDLSFQGIYMQVHLSDGTQPVGTWQQPNSDFTLENCLNPEDTILQSNLNSKTLDVQFVWNLPSTPTGNYKVVATVFHSQEIFWTEHLAYIENSAAVAGNCVDVSCNQGLCWTGLSTNYFCQCSSGYDGQNCENIKESHICNDGTECFPNGVCYQSSTFPGTFICICKQHYTGERCEIVEMPCDSNPCQNGGTCRPNGENYECACPNTHTGTTCTEVACTEGVTCKNGGTCNASPNKICDCPAGFRGEYCETSGKDHCSSNPCLNGATCLNRATNFSCVCARNFNGTTCAGKIAESNTQRELPLEIWWIALLALVGLLLIVIIIITIISVICRSNQYDDDRQTDSNRKPYA